MAWGKAGEEVSKSDGGEEAGTQEVLWQVCTNCKAARLECC